jgi:hypothetical protein
MINPSIGGKRTGRIVKRPHVVRITHVHVEGHPQSYLTQESGDANKKEPALVNPRTAHYRAQRTHKIQALVQFDRLEIRLYACPKKPGSKPFLSDGTFGKW